MIGLNQTKANLKSEPEIPCLAMRPREAAKSLGISERLLWEWTNAGLVPHIRINRAILYPTDALNDWLRRRAEAAITDAKKISEKTE